MPSRSDVILPMTDDCMQQIIRREKTYEFRKYLLNASVKRVWFYLKAPLSHVSHVCDIDPARTRRPGDAPLPEDGVGNKLFNERHPSWAKNDFAYRVRSVRELVEPLSLAAMKQVYGVGIAPRGMIYTPEKMLQDVLLDSMKLLWCFEGDGPVALKPVEGCSHAAGESRGVMDQNDSGSVSKKRRGAAMEQQTACPPAKKRRRRD